MEQQGYTNTYYVPPTDALFEEMKAAAIKLWQEKYPEAEHPHYAEEKVARIKDIKNVSDNFMYIVAMFDSENQSLLASKLSEETRKAVHQRMVAGGAPNYMIPF